MTPSINLISIIIPSYNSFSTIKHCLNAIDQQSRKEFICEIIIVDSSDDQQTKSFLSTTAYPLLQIIHSSSRTIPALARNIGAKIAKGNILAFIDADAYPHKDWIKYIQYYYDKGHILGGGSISIPIFQLYQPLPVSQYFLQFNEYLPYGKPRIKSFVPSCNLYCSKTIFEKVNGFPLLRAAEDVLFGLKASKIEPLLFIPEIQVFHIFRTQLNSYLRNQRLLGKYTVVYRRMYYPDKLYKGKRSLVLLPVFFFYKLITISLRTFKSGSRNTFMFITSFPFFILGLFALSIGFLNGCLTKVDK